MVFCRIKLMLGLLATSFMHLSLVIESVGARMRTGGAPEVITEPTVEAQSDRKFDIVLIISELSRGEKIAE